MSSLRVFVCGSEQNVRHEIVGRILSLIHGPQALQPMTELLSINKPGVDQDARDWAAENSIPIVIEENPNQEQYGDMADQLAYGRAIARGMPDQILVLTTAGFNWVNKMVVQQRANFFNIPLRILYVTQDWTDDSPVPVLPV